MHDYTNQICPASFLIKQEEAGIIDWHSSKCGESNYSLFAASSYIYNNNNIGKSSVPTIERLHLSQPVISPQCMEYLLAKQEILFKHKETCIEQRRIFGIKCIVIWKSLVIPLMHKLH